MQHFPMVLIDFQCHALLPKEGRTDGASTGFLTEDRWGARPELTSTVPHVLMHGIM